MVLPLWYHCWLCHFFLFIVTCVCFESRRGAFLSLPVSAAAGIKHWSKEHESMTLTLCYCCWLCHFFFFIIMCALFESRGGAFLSLPVPAAAEIKPSISRSWVDDFTTVSLLLALSFLFLHNYVCACWDLPGAAIIKPLVSGSWFNDFTTVLPLLALSFLLALNHVCACWEQETSISNWETCVIQQFSMSVSIQESKYTPLLKSLIPTPTLFGFQCMSDCHKEKYLEVWDCIHNTSSSP